MHKLNVYINATHIAYLSLSDDWEYIFAYLEGYDGFHISPHIKVGSPIASISVKNFLHNLLPEGRALEDVLRLTHIPRDNIFALISELGYESSGALSFASNVEQKQTAVFREITTSELIERLENIDEQSIAVWDNKPRLSLAGVQDKLAVHITQDKTMGLADGALSSTHILKFQTKRFNHIALNEYYCMYLAKRCHIDTASCALRKFGDYLVLEVERFDRIVRNDTVERLHIIDGCQMLNLPPFYKYERAFGKGRDVARIREGVSFRKIFEATKLTSVPAVARLKMLDWALFNLVIGNSDAHGKNLSFYVRNSGMEVAPFYDMVSTVMYDGIEHDLSMAFGDEFDINGVLGYDLVAFADSINLPKKLVSDRLRLITRAVLQHGDMAIEGLCSEESDFLQELTHTVKTRAEKYQAISKEMLHISD